MTNKELIDRLSRLELWHIHRCYDDDKGGGFEYTRLPDVGSYVQDYEDAGWVTIAIWQRASMAVEHILRRRLYGKIETSYPHEKIVGRTRRALEL